MTSVSDTELMEITINNFLRELHTCQPAIVQRYYPERGPTIDCIPLISKLIPRSKEDETGAPRELPWVDEPRAMFMNVRVMWPRAGGFVMTMPLQKGDTVLLLHPQQDIGRWISTSHTRAASPDFDIHHPGTNAVAIPGLYPNARKLAEGLVASDSIVFGHEASGGKVEMKADSLEVFGATERAGIESKLLGEFQKVSTTLASLTGGSGTPAVFGTPYVPGSDLGSDRLKTGG